MKKFSVVVCVCVALLSFGIYGKCVREVSAQIPGAEENTYETAEASDILEYTKMEEVAAAYPFLQEGTVVDAGGYEIYAIVPGCDCKISVYLTQIRKTGNIWMT